MKSTKKTKLNGGNNRIDNNRKAGENEMWQKYFAKQVYYLLQETLVDDGNSWKLIHVADSFKVFIVLVCVRSSPHVCNLCSVLDDGVLCEIEITGATTQYVSKRAAHYSSITQLIRRIRRFSTVILRVIQCALRRSYGPKVFMQSIRYADYLNAYLYVFMKVFIPLHSPRKVHSGHIIFRFYWSFRIQYGQHISLDTVEEKRRFYDMVSKISFYKNHFIFLDMMSCARSV